MSSKNNFTIKFLESIPLPAAGKRTYVYDTKVSGLGASVTSKGIITFFVYRKINGVPTRVAIGRFPDLTIELARNKALDTIRKIAQGINPIAEKRELQAKGVTLAEVLEAYIKARKSLKPSTIKDYKRSMFEMFSDWQDKPLREITKDMIAKRHTSFGERSKARANLGMRVIRALFNFAKGEYEDSKGQSLFIENPVARLSHTRAWFKINPRRGSIKDHQLKAWFDSVMALPDDTIVCKSGTVRDYLLTLLFTGLRRQECVELTWDKIDLKDGTLAIDDPKNREPFLLPFPKFITNLLISRYANKYSKFVFPGDGKDGFINDPTGQIERVIVASGVSFSPHDLRRTFISIAEGLEISPYVLKKLLNHKRKPNDVTADYIIISTARLRKNVSKIENYILDLVR